MQKNITVALQTSYEVLGTLSPQTETIWIVCHGYGQLSKHFIRRFDVLDPQTNYVIAPQGLSKFYLNGKYEEVGASWLTKEDRIQDIQNQLHYLDNVFDQEIPEEKQKDYRYCLLGFSQGATTIGRWAVHRQLRFEQLVLWAGRFPHEVQVEQLQFIPPTAQILTVIGTEDELITPTIWQQELQHLTQLFGKTLSTIYFEGGHEVKREVIRQVAQRLATPSL